MRKYCPKCRMVVDRSHTHQTEMDWSKYKYKDDKGVRRIRNSVKWRNKREEIKRRDGGIDQIAANGLDGPPYIETRNLQVHHIEPLNERPDLAFDNDNLITVSPRTHELAESGLIEREKLHEIARGRGKRIAKQ